MEEGCLGDFNEQAGTYENRECLKYLGHKPIRDLKVMVNTLKLKQKGIGSQSTAFKIGVTWALKGVPASRMVAKYCTSRAASCGMHCSSLNRRLLMCETISSDYYHP